MSDDRPSDPEQHPEGTTPPAPPSAPPVYGQSAHGQEQPSGAQGATPSYGQQPYGQPAYGGAPGYQPRKTPVLGIIGMICGIVSVVFFWIYGLGIFPAAAAIVLGFLSRRKETASKGFWLTALITGFVGLALAIIVIIVVIVAFTYLAHHSGQYSNG